MVGMVHIARFAIALAGACLIGFAAGIVLTRLHADAGWYYGLTILLAGIVGLRTLTPDAGISINGLRRRHQSSREGHGHLPSPLA
jgi:hypothetical protein